MAGTGRAVKFHGSFKSKARARRKEREVPGSYIQTKRVKGQGLRHLVVTRRRGR